MKALEHFTQLNRDQRNTFVACFLGWALDALDFFLLTFVFTAVAKEFGRSVPEVAFTSMLTLMMRPIGALIFGMLGDRYGRRVPLMIDIVFYSAMEFATAFAPNFTVFLIFRALFGIGMGGEWGLGASLAMETLPVKSRGFFSGLLQQGYAFGFLLAALVYALVFPHFGWRGLFVAGAMPALLVLFIRARVPESPSWKRQHVTAMPLIAIVKNHWRILLYAMLLMTAFNCMSHGTQDLYPTFLQKQRGLAVDQVRNVTVIYSLGAICGGTLVGALSQTWGRRRSIVFSAALGLLLIPAWIFSPALWLLIVGGFCMQFMVQGAWGVVPVHLNELSPADLRGTFPGFAYQLGNLCASPIAVVEAKLAEHFASPDGQANYAMSLAIVVAAVFVVLITVAALGRERRGLEF